ncbi:Zinc finger protein CONSTANS-LIKE 10 [Forsythia ovata]|uniref:Zinc finger protein CONSTANS-LIKE 10 n=1 Tax=Forsythia ovata TaxID=205694 RepID=A0ABD1S447_9LAMI
MGQLCDFCGEQRSMVYCRSDAACLCLSCDRNVHSANALSRHHSRTLVCEQCNSQPAAVRFIEEEISLCENCNWSSHVAPASAADHKQQSINCYSGCPSAAQLYSIWSFFSADYSSCNPEIGSTSLEKKDQNLTYHSLPPMKCSIAEAAMDPVASDVDKISGSRFLNSLNEKACSSRTKHLEPFDEDDLCKDLNISDIDLGLNDCEELFGESLDDPQQFFENGGIENLFEIGSVHSSEINTECVYAVKDSSSSQNKIKEMICSNPISADRVTSCKTDPNTFLPRKALSTPLLSFSGLTGESSTGNHQECGMSSMLIIGEPPWHFPCPKSQETSSSRDCAVLRYREKKKSRKFNKRIRYASRKVMADVRKRVKGRFVKAGDPYDYDPLCQTRSK